MSPARGELPYVDEHSITIAAPRTGVERVAALRRHIAALLEGSPIARLLGTQPRAGFDILDIGPAHSLLRAGRRRFSRCRLTFELTDAAKAATHLRARTCVVLPATRGQANCALVIGT
jgi:hypothetical protein